jgi:hypothetical protein
MRSATLTTLLTIAVIGRHLRLISPDALLAKSAKVINAAGISVSCPRISSKPGAVMKFFLVNNVIDFPSLPALPVRPMR